MKQQKNKFSGMCKTCQKMVMPDKGLIFYYRRGRVMWQRLYHANDCLPPKEKNIIMRIAGGENEKPRSGE